MHENGCEVLRPGEHCKFGGRFDLLEKRVEELEKGQDAAADFRKTYYQDREDRRVRDALLDDKMKRMEAKLDQLVEWKDEQLNRPNLLFDSIRDKLVVAVTGVIGAGIIAGLIWLVRAMGRG